MPSRTPNPEGVPSETETTLAEFLCTLPTLEMRRDLEAFRIQYEAEHGETDLTRRYTCTWSPNAQEWLIRNYPKRFWDGLPPFLQAFLKSKMRAAARDGRLDDKPDVLIRLFLTGEMTINGHDGPHR